jgi:hypothetical protein
MEKTSTPDLQWVPKFKKQVIWSKLRDGFENYPSYDLVK